MTTATYDHSVGSVSAANATPNMVALEHHLYIE